MSAVREFKVAASQPRLSSNGPAASSSTLPDGAQVDGEGESSKRQDDAQDADARRRAALDAFSESLKKDKVSLKQ